MQKHVAATGWALLMFGIPVASHAAVTDADRTFLTKDVQGSRYELALAKLGTTQATMPKIRHYAQMVAHDHMIANAALGQLVKQEGVDVPAGMTSEDTQRLARMRDTTGKAFNQSFLDEQSRINDSDQHDSDKELASTNEPAIKAFINRFASMDEKHKHAAEQLKGTS